MRIKTNDEPQGPNLMCSRHGASANALQKCAQCRHLIRVADALQSGEPWYCNMFTTPGHYKMPWDHANRACELFEGRTDEVAPGH